MSDFQSFRKDVEALVGKFKQDKHHYLSKGYPEAQVRIDFLNPFFDALGRDIAQQRQEILRGNTMFSLWAKVIGKKIAVLQKAE